MATRNLNLVITSNFASAVRGFEILGGSVGRLQKSFSNARVAGLTLTALGATAAIAIGTQAVNAFIDFDDAMTKSLAIMGEVSGPMRKRMEDAAKKIATQTTFSATEAAGAYYDLASAGLSAEQSIDALPTVATFAQAGLMDLSEATDYLTGAQQALGLRMEDPIENMEQMTRVADVLTEANNIALGTVEDFAEALSNKAAGAMRANNVELEEGVAVLAAFASQGVIGSSAGEKLAIALRDIPRAAMRNSEEFEKLGISVFDSSGNLRNMADVVAEFEQALGPLPDGAKAAAFENLGLTRSVGDILRQLMGTSPLIRQYEGDLRAAGGTTKEVAEKQMESLRAKLEILGNRWENFLITIGEPVAVWLVDTLIPWVENTAIPAVERFGQSVYDNVVAAFRDLQPHLEPLRPLLEDVNNLLANKDVQAGIAGWIALAAGVKGASVIFAGLKAVLIVLATPFKLIASIIGFLLAPIGALVTAIGFVPIAIAALVVGAGVAIYIFRDQVWDALVSVGRFFNMLWQDWIYPPMRAVIDWFSGPFADFWAGLWNQFGPQIMKVVGSVIDAFKSIATETGETISTIVEYWAILWHFIQPYLSLLWNNIKTIFGAIVDIVDSMIRPVWNLLVSVLGGAFKVAVSVIREFGPIVWGVFLRIWDVVTDVIGGLVKAIGGIVTFVMNVFQGDWGQAWESIKDVFAGVWDAIFSIGQNAIGLVIDIVKQFPGAFWRAIKVLGPVLLDIGINLIKGIWAGLKAGASALWNIIKGIFTGFIDFVKGIFGINSPSTVFAEIGRFLIEGLWNGIKGAFTLVVNFFRGAFEVIGAVISAVWNGVVKPVFGFIADVVTNVVIPALQFFIGVWRAIFSAAASVISWLWNNVVGPVFRFLVSFITGVVIPAIQFYFQVWQTIFHAVAAVVQWAWNNIVRPVFSAIVGVITNVVIPIVKFLWTVWSSVWTAVWNIIRAAWTNVIFPVFQAIWGFITTVLIPVFQAIWNKVRDVFTAVWTIIQAAWNNVILPVFQAVWGFIIGTLIPIFQSLWEKVRDVWTAIKDAISAAWNWVRDNVFNPIVSFIDNTVLPGFGRLKRGVEGAFNAIKSLAARIWGNVTDIIKGAINTAIRFINKIIGGINVILRVVGIPEIGSIPLIGDSASNPAPVDRRGGNRQDRRLARGGPIPMDSVGSGFITNGPRAIVGEGRQQYPEFVIPTDPAYRKRALGLYEKLGYSLMASGGYLGLDPRFGAAVQKVIQEGRGQVTISSGLRSRADQERLYALYQSGRGNLAARPGTSKHERGLAVDFGGNRALYQQLARKHGLIFPVGGEPWHAEPSWAGGGVDGGSGGGGGLSAAEIVRQVMVAIVGEDALGGAVSRFVAAAAQTGEDIISSSIAPITNVLGGGGSSLFDEVAAQGVDGLLSIGKSLTNRMIDAFAPIEFVRGGAKYMRDKVWTWIKDKALEQEAQSMGGPGGNANFSGGGVEQWRGVALRALSAAGAPSSWIGSLLRRMQQESGGNPGAVNNWDCVPLRTTILTDRGWLTHDEVRVGDRTIGYNPETGRSEWTRINRVVHYENADLVRIGNKRWSVETTPNHRWASITRTDDTVSMRTVDDFNTNTKIALAFDFDGGQGLDITVAEAELLGWIAGDGVVNHSGSISFTVGVPKYEDVDALLPGIPDAVACYEYSDTCRTHRLTPAYTRDLIARVGDPKGEVVKIVMAMSSEQRHAWVRGIQGADGARSSGVIYQTDGPIAEAIHLAGYLTGHRVSVGRDERNPDSWSPVNIFALCKPIVTTGGSFNVEDIESADVWCVTTDLGTWTAEQDGQVFLTGNSNARRGQASRGLMQTIPSTFAAYAGPYASRGINDPFANIYAAIKYTMSRYGSGPAGWDRPGGYARGGNVSGDQIARLHDKEMVLPAHLAEHVRNSAGRPSGNSVVIENLVIHAETEEGGRRAAKGFKEAIYMDTLEERRIQVLARSR